MNFIKNTVLFLAILGSFMGACSQTPKELLTAAQQTEQYFPFLKGKKVGLLDADIYGPSVPIMFGLENKRLKVAK